MTAKGNDKSMEEQTNAEKSPEQVTAWLQDVSLEVLQPVHRMFNPGERQMEFMARLQTQDGPQPSLSLYSNIVNIHILANGKPYMLLEVIYSCIAEKAQDAKQEQSVAEALYHEARPYIEQLLAMSGHTPPLPEVLNQ